MGLSKDNNIHIANNTWMDVHVLVSPNKDYVIGDITATVATTVASAIVTSGGSLGEVPARIKSFSDLWKLLKLLKTMGTVVGLGIKTSELIANHTIRIAPHEVKNVLHKALYNPLDYLGPTGWAAIFGGSEITIAVLLYNPKMNVVEKLTKFNTNSDYSWLVSSLPGVVRVKYGKLWVPQKGGIVHAWEV